MKRLHGIRVTFWGQIRHKRNRQKAWRKNHTEWWNIFGFLRGNAIETKPVWSKEFPNRPQRNLNKA